MSSNDAYPSATRASTPQAPPEPLLISVVVTQRPLGSTLEETRGITLNSAHFTREGARQTARHLLTNIGYELVQGSSTDTGQEVFRPRRAPTDRLYCWVEEVGLEMYVASARTVEETRDEMAEANRRRAGVD